MSRALLTILIDLGNVRAGHHHEVFSCPLTGIPDSLPLWESRPACDRHVMARTHLLCALICVADSTLIPETLALAAQINR
jgi:hypothetical protein